MEELKDKVRQILTTYGIGKEEQGLKKLEELLKDITATDCAKLIMETYRQGVSMFYDDWNKQKEKNEDLNKTLELVKDRVFEQFLSRPNCN